MIVQGVAYNIDTYKGNCTVTPIPLDNDNGFFQPLNMTAVNMTGAEILELKSPNQMFYLDNSYVYTGQVWRHDFFLIDLLID
jgi:hypothetical protein